MNILKKISGKILNSTAQLISVMLDVFIGIIEVIVTLVNTIAKGFVALIGMGGCLLFFIFTGPLAFALLLNPITFLIIMFFVIFPILGTKFVSYLKYVKYMTTEFLFDRANYLMHGTSSQFESFSEYGNKYKKAEEARKRKEQQERQAQQQKEWEERFRQWYEYQNSQRGNTGYGSYGSYEWYSQNNGYSNDQPFNNPTIEFKSKYEKSCDILGVVYNADKYQIKLAYRKKAKEYHPDINKSADSTKMFQEINNAYEFLSESNIERYKSMK